ncbi:MAG: hypothetical protein SV422_15630, partial [Pseudomonadota bacterium]|nr:hypothetical protein [Pseudomonadota bacterium]
IRSSRAVPAAGIATELVPSPDATQQLALDQWRRDPNTALSMSPALLAHGVHPEAYRLSQDGSQYRVYVHLPDDDRLVLLSSFKDRAKAIDYAHKFRRIVIDLNLESEGLHLVEHQLLRPRASEPDGADSFFTSRVSIVLPGRTARFANPAFRRFAQKTVSDQLPAHVLPDFHWLDPAELEAFETHYEHWLDVQLQANELGSGDADAGGSLTVLDSASAALADWLRARAPAQERWV